MTNDVGKLVGLVLICLMVGVLLWGGKISEAVAAGVIGGVVGYLTGNGVNAVRKQAPSPVVVPKFSHEEVEDAAVQQAAAELVRQAAEQVTVGEQAQAQGWPAEAPGRHLGPFPTPANRRPWGDR